MQNIAGTLLIIQCIIIWYLLSVLRTKNRKLKKIETDYKKAANTIENQTKQLLAIHSKFIQYPTVPAVFDRIEQLERTNKVLSQRLNQQRMTEGKK